MKKKSLVAMAAALLLAAGSLYAGEELEIGAAAPSFSLTNAVDGKNVSFKPADGKTKVVIFTCNQCPYAKAFEARLASIGKTYADKGVAFYAINPNDVAQNSEESLEAMKTRAAEKGFPFPYLKDADSSIAAAYGARVTPHVFVVDGAGKVAYRGYVDDSAKEDRTHAGLTEALDSLVAKQPVKVTSTKAFGCKIKWKKSA